MGCPCWDEHSVTHTLRDGPSSHTVLQLQSLAKLSIQVHPLHKNTTTINNIHQSTNQPTNQPTNLVMDGVRPRERVYSLLHLNLQTWSVQNGPHMVSTEWSTHGQYRMVHTWSVQNGPHMVSTEWSTHGQYRMVHTWSVQNGPHMCMLCYTHACTHVHLNVPF